MGHRYAMYIMAYGCHMGSVLLAEAIKSGRICVTEERIWST